jgi:hypothetical protein
MCCRWFRCCIRALRFLRILHALVFCCLCVSSILLCRLLIHNRILLLACNAANEQMSINLKPLNALKTLPHSRLRELECRLSIRREIVQQRELDTSCESEQSTSSSRSSTNTRKRETCCASNICPIFFAVAEFFAARINNLQRAACSVQRAACSVQRAACSVQRAACSVQRAARNEHTKQQQSAREPVDTMRDVQASQSSHVCNKHQHCVMSISSTWMNLNSTQHASALSLKNAKKKQSSTVNLQESMMALSLQSNRRHRVSR